ncbi:MAG TPA: tryptophan--tRNA ligase [Rhodospirillaceae bacterium]|nr:MAG: tryptophan--tRNA ligase [Alphaproteobacteria bacterium GWF2_58_20]HAU29279.1 tryptophan--tRNA ligase [Rhodospirillaceae bacterium]
MKRIFSGVQPTNKLHIGNYLGAIRNWVKLQDDPTFADAEKIFCVVDLHAITLPQDPVALRQNVRDIAAAYVACGIDPAKASIFPQSAVAAHSELSWILGCITPMGWLNRMTQFKEKAGKHREEAGLGLYSYPVLMAADILLYKTSHVPVGEDQKQHLELARDLAGAFNRRYGVDYFPLPEPIIMGEGARIMNLRDGTQKMSKSAESDMTRINLTDDADTIALKIRKAKTDPDPLPETIEALEKRPEADNLVTIFALLDDTSRKDVLSRYSGKMFSEFKPALAELAVEKLSPISARMRELQEHPDALNRILIEGTEKVRALAEKDMEEIRHIVGFTKMA